MFGSKKLQEKLDEEKREKLKIKAKLELINDTVIAYKETNGNAFTYMRKISNILSE